MTLPVKLLQNLTRRGAGDRRRNSGMGSVLLVSAVPLPYGRLFFLSTWTARPGLCDFLPWSHFFWHISRKTTAWDTTLSVICWCFGVFFFASTLSKPMLIVIVTEAFHSSLPSLSGQRSKALSEHPSWMDGSFLFIFFFIFLLSCSFSLRSSYLLWWHDSWVLVAVQWILFLCSGEKDEVPFGLSKDNRENRFERLI